MSASVSTSVTNQFPSHSGIYSDVIPSSLSLFPSAPTFPLLLGFPCPRSFPPPFLFLSLSSFLPCLSLLPPPFSSLLTSLCSSHPTVVAPVIVNLTASPSTGVSQGVTLNLTCEAVGRATLNFTWTTPTGPRLGSVISVDNVTANDAGEYRCEVTSEAETTNDSITITGEGD